MAECAPNPLIEGAIRWWEPLAARAWADHERHGRGVLVMQAEELVGRTTPPTPTFIPVAMVPQGDDFRPVLQTYDPERQIVLLVRDGEGEETLLTVGTDGERPTPRECAEG